QAADGPVSRRPKAPDRRARPSHVRGPHGALTRGRIRDPRRLVGRASPALRMMGPMPDEVVIDAQVQGGKPVLRGTRVTVDAVVRALAAGDDHATVARAFRLTVDQVRAALVYAADILGTERAIALPD